MKKHGIKCISKYDILFLSLNCISSALKLCLKLPLHYFHSGRFHNMLGFPGDFYSVSCAFLCILPIGLFKWTSNDLCIVAPSANRTTGYFYRETLTIVWYSDMLES